jgi:topoisomerase IA-like protein
MAKRKKLTEAEAKKLLAEIFAKGRRYAKKAIARQRARQKYNHKKFGNLRLP